MTSSINFTKNIAVFQISSSLARPSAAQISSSIIFTEIPIFLTLRKIHITSIIPRDIREDIVWKSFSERKKVWDYCHKFIQTLKRSKMVHFVDAQGLSLSSNIWKNAELSEPGFDTYHWYSWKEYNKELNEKSITFVKIF